MDPARRTLLRVQVPDRSLDPEAARGTTDLVERLMGRKPELRFAFIQENARFVRDLDV
jgi:topoisomerase-4 subunit B